MLVQILILIAGLLLIIFGADYLVEGSSSIAKKLKVNEFVIGLTIVGIGTSAPELVVSFMGALKGNADIALGNVIGSNILNTLLILGITAIIYPIKISKNNSKKDIPLNIFVTILLILFGLNYKPIELGTINRIEGLIFIILFALYMYFSFNTDKKDTEQKIENGKAKEINILIALIMMIGGLAALIYGGRLFVNSAINIAKIFGVSDKFIAITILAGGTSMPELATCIVAACKKRDEMALGNILGSNIANILLILGGSAIISPLTMSGISYFDLITLLISSIIIWLSIFTFKKQTLDRKDGILFLSIEFAYFLFLIINL